MIGIKPLGDRVAIKKLEAEEKTQGGLILTSSAKEQPNEAAAAVEHAGARSSLLCAAGKVIFKRVEGDRYDIGTPEGFLKATVAYACRVPEWEKVLIEEVKKRTGGEITPVLCERVGKCVLERMPFERLRETVALAFGE